MPHSFLVMPVLLEFAIEGCHRLWGPWKGRFREPDVMQKGRVLDWLIIRDWVKGIWKAGEKKDKEDVRDVRKVA